MKLEEITRRDELVVRRLVLEPGEAMFWHHDNCHRFTVVVQPAPLKIEYLDGDSIEVVTTRGQADWDAPEERVHRAVNTGPTPYEEVVSFYRENAAIEPQPQHSP